MGTGAEPAGEPPPSSGRGMAGCRCRLGLSFRVCVAASLLIASALACALWSARQGGVSGLAEPTPGGAGSSLQPGGGGAAAARLLKKKGAGSPSLRNWCTGCEPESLCRRKFLFIVSTGRAGSTTTMNMVNKIPGVVLYGENGEQVRLLRQMYEYWRHPRGHTLKQKLRGNADSFVHANVSTSDLLAKSQRLFWAWLPPPNGVEDVAVRGFKEVRWTPEDLTFISQMAPCSRFIFNYRLNLTQQSKSAWFKARKDTEELLRNQTNMLRAALHKLPQPFYPVTAENLTVAAFNGLASWLGSACRFNDVTHSNAQGGYEIAGKAMRVHCRPPP